MIRFVIEICILCVALAASYYWILSKADGYTDAYYLRFSTPQQTSLILGTSRAAQGLQPKVINELLQRDDLFNYSFTVVSSPYGKLYLETIKKKLDSGASDGIYILSVDPWGISSLSEDPNNVAQFRENGTRIEIESVNDHPNVDYMLNYYEGLYAGIFLNKTIGFMVVREDGWLQMDISLDDASRERRLRNTLRTYDGLIKEYKFSSKRMAYLEKTVQYLSRHGDVFIVRIPVHPEMMKLDNLLMPKFDEKMEMLASKTGARYLSLENLSADCSYIDGNHLDVKSSEKVSKEVAEWISSQLGKP